MILGSRQLEHFFANPGETLLTESFPACAVLVDDSADLTCGPDGAEIVQTLEVDGDTLTFVSEADTIANGGEQQPVVFTRAQWGN